MCLPFTDMSRDNAMQFFLNARAITSTSYDWPNVSVFMEVYQSTSTLAPSWWYDTDNSIHKPNRRLSIVQV